MNIADARRSPEPSRAMTVSRAGRGTMSGATAAPTNPAATTIAKATFRDAAPKEPFSVAHHPAIFRTEAGDLTMRVVFNSASRADGLDGL
jgi:hypothetical protein